MSECKYGCKESVYYNSFNKVVQCHECGQVFVKASKLKYFLNRFFKWW